MSEIPNIFGYFRMPSNFGGKAKVTKKIRNHQRKSQNNSSVCQNNGSDEQALGALMRMVFAMVGAMRSMVTGVFTRSAFVPAP